MLVSGSTPGAHHHGSSSISSGGLVVLIGAGGDRGSGLPSGISSATSNVVGAGGGGAGTCPVGVEPVQATIWHCLNNYAFSDACFLAERIHAECPSEDSLHVLATSYYRCGSKTKTYVLLSTCMLKSPQHMTPKNRYLLSLVCYELEKYDEAEATLLKSVSVEGKTGSSVFEQLERIYGDISPFALKLYALVCVATERCSQAYDAFTRCLKLNPFLWNCYEYCCSLGERGTTPTTTTTTTTSNNATTTTRDRNKENMFDSNRNPAATNANNARNKQQQRVFQLPDSALQGSVPAAATITTQQQQHNSTTPPQSYLPQLIGSTAASLVLHHPQPTKWCTHDPPHNNPNQNNNQNYFAKDTSLLNSSNSNVFMNSSGVLHPSNRNNIKPSKRNLFTSTPMGGNNVNQGGGPNSAAPSTFGIIPLMMDSSSTSTLSNAGGVQSHAITGSSINLTNSTMSPSLYSSPVGVVPSMPGQHHSSLVHSPVVGDFTDELEHRSGGNSAVQSHGTTSEPRPKKQGTTTTSGPTVSTTNVTTTPSNPPAQHGTVTISTASNHTLRRSSRLFTHHVPHHHHHHHSGFLKENNKQGNVIINPVMMATPPSSNNVITPESGGGGGGSGRRKQKLGANSVLKPKLRLNKSQSGGSGGSSSSTATLAGDTDSGTPANMKVEPASQSMDGSGEFFRCVLDKSEVEDKCAAKGGGGDNAAQARDDRVSYNVEAFRNGVDPLLHILSNLSAPYTSQTTYNCKTAIAQYQRLKPSQCETGWVIGNIARCYFELGNYEECIKHYKRMMEIEPWRTEGLEWLSTAYWHLQKETELSALAQDLMKSNRTNEVATWVASGNCFSLHKEHETAIKFFRRAIQVNSNCAYAYTLLGHEYVLTEELEKAMRCFRTATRIDRNHYNAWYGMGMIFYKQERYERAEVYYRKALAIHPNNSVLLCHLGVVQHALGRAEKSLATFTRALEANGSDPLCKFHRASVLFAIGKLDDALDELEELKEIVPKESLVYFLIAKIFSKKGDTHKALLHFTWATDLDPKGANNQIKESIEPVLSRTAAGTSGTGHALLTTVNSTAVGEQSASQDEEEDDDDDDDDDDEEEEDDDDDDEDEVARDDRAANDTIDNNSTRGSANNNNNNNARVSTRNSRGRSPHPRSN